MFEVPIWLWSFLLGMATMNTLITNKEKIMKWLQNKSDEYNEKHKTNWGFACDFERRVFYV
jgi:hypothetical protein